MHTLLLTIKIYYFYIACGLPDDKKVIHYCNTDMKKISLKCVLHCSWFLLHKNIHDSITNSGLFFP